MMKKLSGYILSATAILLFATIASSAQTTRLTRPKTLVLTDVTLIDATGSPAQPNMTVVITGDRITSLGRTGKVRLPKGAQVIKASGKFLIPGLWDMHTHLSFYADAEPSLTAFPALIANGVTGVRDMGGNFEQINKWRKEIADGTIVGPRIFQAGPYVDGAKKMNEFRQSLTIVVNNAEEARRAVATLKQRGVDFIKVHNGVSRDAYLALADECRKQGVPLATHLPRSVRAAEASDAGTRSLEHTETLIESIVFADAGTDGKSKDPLKDPLTAMAEFDDEKARALFARFARNGTCFVPTLVGYRSFVRDGERRAAADVKSKEAAAGRQKLFQRFIQLVGLMQRSGVNVMAATDFARKKDGEYPVPRAGFDLHDELALFVEAGMTPMQALQTATRNPAQCLGKSDSLGTIEKGKLADLILLEANPLDRITNTRQIAAVIVNGNLILKPQLQAMLLGAEDLTQQRTSRPQ